MHSMALGTSALRVSSIAYGCWRLAGSEGVEAPADAADLGRRAVLAAADSGFTLFDLADIYGGGRCEEIFGAALRERPGLRDRIVVVSKCGIRKAGVPDSGSPYRYDGSAEHIRTSVEASLRRMGIETLDVLLLHRPDFLMAPDEVAGACAQLRDGGKVREFGVSNFRPGQVAMLQKACPFPLVTNQVEISLIRREALEDGTLDQCLAERITPMAWSPLARGALMAAAPDDPGGLSRVLDAVAADRGLSRSAVALAWLMAHPAGILPIIGSVQPSRILESSAAAGIRLSREEWYRLLTAARGSRLP
ncbi:MAG: aldo/keto reductase [Verrucomicrobia bacterium]|nr:aldo/keto reductase [Verrucomicrobiota bacterium]